MLLDAVILFCHHIQVALGHHIVEMLLYFGYFRRQFNNFYHLLHQHLVQPKRQHDLFLVKVVVCQLALLAPDH